MLSYILYVDDDKDDYDVFSEVVQEINPSAVIHYLHDSEKIDEVLKITPPEIIFLDFNMPKVNGIECLKKIRAYKELDKIPVILYSVYFDKIEEAFRNGANYFILKQWSVSNAKGIIKTMLERDWKDESVLKSFDAFLQQE
jgi:CheY-like chemotaxis protein